MPLNNDYCLTFWYYVSGNPATVTLRTYISRNQAYSRPEWSRGSMVAGGAWMQAEVPVSVQVAVPLQFIFTVELGNGNSGVALDDISLIDIPCSGGQYGLL